MSNTQLQNPTNTLTAPTFNGAQALVPLGHTAVNGRLVPATVQIVDLTRELAQRLAGVIPDYQKRSRLNTSAGNASIAGYARDMDARRWHLTGDSLIVVTDPDGNWLRLVQGQHRVMARLASSTNEPVYIQLQTQIDASAEDGDGDDSHLDPLWDALDTGRGRTLSQALHRRNVKFYNQMSVLVRNCAQMGVDGTSLTRYRTGGHANSPAVLTVTEAIAFWENEIDHSIALEAARLGDRAQRNAKVPKHLAHYVAYVSLVCGLRDETFDFWERVINPNKFPDMQTNHPAVKLAERFLTYHNARTAGERVDRSVSLYFVVRCWHAFLRGETLTILRRGELSTLSVVVPTDYREDIY